jgi:serine/threonine-protein kinase
MTELDTGAIVASHYVVVSLLGTGGMGAVYRARDTRTDTQCAIKVLRQARGDLAARFIREARITSTLAHPNIARVHEVLELDDGSPAIVMELLDGESLGAQLARLGKLAPAAIARICIGVVAAIKAAHARGVIHRDLKPDNIFLCEDGTVKVLDFGIAKVTFDASDPAITAAALTETGQLLGTPQYMAPEQIFGEKDIDARSDIWALGVTLYQALAGARPFDGENPGQVFKAIALDPPVPLEERAPYTPPELVRLVGRMLVHARAERLADLEEVTRVLERVVAGDADTQEVASPRASGVGLVVAVPPKPAPSSAARSRRSAVVIVASALAIGAAVVALRSPAPSAPPAVIVTPAPKNASSASSNDEPAPAPSAATASPSRATAVIASPPSSAPVVKPPPTASSRTPTVPAVAISATHPAPAVSAQALDAGTRPNRSGPLKRDEF